MSEREVNPGVLRPGLLPHPDTAILCGSFCVCCGRGGGWGGAGGGRGGRAAIIMLSIAPLRGNACLTEELWATV